MGGFRKMLATELIEKLQMAISGHGNLPVFDWDNDEITIINMREAETIAYGIAPWPCRYSPLGYFKTITS
jgi:hypothetical protein